MNLQDLNEAQREAVKCIDAPSLVIAGAGSGKTRVLTYKVAYLLEQGFNPWNILALTFTNKAAREMQQRIGQLVDTELANNLWMGTFHSIFSRILRIESAALGFTSDFTIYDASDSKSLVKTIIREMQLDDKVYKPATICNRISEAKNRLVFPNQYLNSPQIRERDEAQRIVATGQIYLRYMQRCRLSNAMDFDDLLLYTFYLFDQHPEVLQKYEQRFHYVLVDEYQDTNYAQHRIVWQLTQRRQRVCVVGDDAQSIYSFRGANIDNILNFQKMYEGAKLFKLERNYRSTQNIVNAANSLIAHNRGQIHKDVYSEKVEGKPIQLYNLQSDYEESIVVSRRIETLHSRDHIPYKDIAILYRTNSQSRSLEEQLRKMGQPYRIYGGLSFYQRKEIKDVIAYLRLSLNPRDEEALKRIINYPTRGLGDTTLRKILESASTHNVSPWQVIMDPVGMQLNINKGTQKKLEDFSNQIMSFHSLTETTDAFNLTRKIIHESGVAADINRGQEPDDISRQENLQEMLDGIAGFVQERQEQGESCLLSDYLQEVSLLSDLDEDDGNKTVDGDDKVTLMTVHSAKGLEFRVVFLVGLEEQLFPNQMAIEEGTRGIEEERRLMYVAMTRAEEQLHITSARSRFRFGKTEMSSPSRFLTEIDKRYIQNDLTHSNSAANDLFGGKSEGSIFGKRTSSPFGNHSSRYDMDNDGVPAFLRGANRGDSSRNSSANSTSSPSRQSNDASQFPPSVWGKTLKRVSSIPKPAEPAQQTTSQSASQTATTSSAQPVGNSSGALRTGCLVEHSRFGRGEVLSVEGTGLDAKATVKFDNVGTKQLLLRFAKITVIN